MVRNRSAKFCLLFGLSVLTAVPRCGAVNVEAGFDPGVDGAVLALAIQPDGKIIIGGTFATIGGQPRNRIGRLNADGSLDPRFHPDADATVSVLAVQPDGRILVGGSFITLGGQRRQQLGRLNPDGTLDPGFDPAPNRSVSSLAVQRDGKILLGGSFTAIAGQPRTGIARLNPDGTLDSAFAPGANNYVGCVAIQGDGKILMGGLFTTLGGQTRNRIGRLNVDGSVDPAFDPGAGADNTIVALVQQADGKIVVGGYFTMLGGQTRNYLGRLNADGTLDSLYGPAPDDVVWSMALEADGRLWVAGWFGMMGGTPQYSISRLNSDGSVEAGSNIGADKFVTALGLQGDGKLLVGGYFDLLNDAPGHHLARLANLGSATQSLVYDGSTATWLRSGTAPEVSRTVFDSSPDGLVWTTLTEGSRISNGWQAAGITLAPGGRIRARGYVAGAANNGSAWFADTIFGPPVILIQPDSLTRNAGTLASFSGLATASEPLSYQWLKDGTPIVDGTNVAGVSTPVLTVSNAFGGDAGGYSLIVSNSAGSVTSIVASLVVMDPLLISEPTSQTRNAGEDVAFSVAVIGTALRYQWWKDGVALPQGTNAPLSLANVQTNDAGKYQVVISNVFGSITSVVATLTVIVPAAFDLYISRNSGTINGLNGIAYGNGRFVVVGDAGTILTSTNSADWSPCSFSNPNDLHGITFGDGAFVAVGRAGTILTSPDGLCWTNQVSGTSHYLKGIAWGNGQYVAVGNGPTLLTSPDSTTWMAQAPNTIKDLNAVAFANGAFVAVGDSGTVVTSADGVTWSLDISGSSKNLRGLTGRNSSFVIVGNDGTTLNSTNAIASGVSSVPPCAPTICAGSLMPMEPTSRWATPARWRFRSMAFPGRVAVQPRPTTCTASATGTAPLSPWGTMGRSCNRPIMLPPG